MMIKKKSILNFKWYVFREKCLIVFLLLIIGFAAPPLFLLTSSPPEREIQPASHLIGQKNIAIVPHKMLRGYDPITVFFPGGTGPSGGGPLDKPGRLFRLGPGHPGETRWIDARTMQFLPAIPWPALQRFTVTVRDKTFSLVTLMASPRRIVPSPGSTGLDPVKEINLIFDAPIDPKQLAAMIIFDVRPLPGVGSGERYRLTSRDFSIKELERQSIKHDARYRVTLHKSIPNGKRVTLTLQLSADPSFEGSLARYSFSTKPLFRLTGIGSGRTIYPVAADGSVYTKEQAMDCGSRTDHIYLKFNDRLAPVSIGQVKQMVRFSPAVRNLRHDVSGDVLRLYFTADRDKLYHMTVKYVPVKNIENRELSSFGSTSLYFYYRMSGPYLKWLAGQGILERYGPRLFPMEGRGMERVDLRVYKLNPLNRNIWPFPRKPVSVDESSRPPGPGEEPEYARSLRQQIRLLGSPLVSEIVPLPLKTSAGMRFGIDLRDHFAKISGPDRPGHYLIGYRVIGSETRRHYVRVQVTDLCLGTVEEENAVTFVVTSLKTGKPVTGAEIKVEGTVGKDWKIFLQGVSNDVGRFRFQHRRDLGNRVTRITVTKGDDVLVLDPQNSPPHYMNNHWYHSYSNWLGWLCSDPKHRKDQTFQKAHIFTERPVYRPEEAVHIKGYVRDYKNRIIKSYDGSRLFYITVFGPGTKKWHRPVKLSQFHSFYCKFIEKDLPTGRYRAVIRQTLDSTPLADVTFQKESYRIPRFEARLHAPERVPLDRKFQVKLLAGYYAGGPVVGRNVSWRVTPFSHINKIPRYSGFLFSSDQRFSGISPGRKYGVITKSDVTDETGSATLDIDPSREGEGGSLRYIVEATVRGADEQTVTATRRIFALSPFALGIKLQRMLKVGMTIKPQVLVIGHDDKPMAGKRFHVKLMQRQWHSYLQESDFTTGKARYVTDVVDSVVAESDHVSGDKAQTLSFPVAEAGVYVVEISARDKQGRLQKVLADLYVAGDTPVSWKKPRANVFSTLAHKRKYNPGDTAKIILKSPFQTARALVVVEGAAANTYHWLPVKNGQAVFHLEIKGDMHPGIPVHFLLMRGRIPTRSQRLETGKQDRAKPITMASTTWIYVNPIDNRLKLQLIHREKKLPGSEMSMGIQMTDPDGRPLDGEVTLWLVDRAVLSLGKEQRLDPLPSFINPVNSFLRISGTRNQAVGNLSPEEIAGGDGWADGVNGGVEGGVVGGLMGEATPMTMAERKLLEQATVRKNFKTTPYFKHDIIVTNGTAEIKIKLPDNLTDFAVRAVATDKSFARFGAAKSIVSIRLPLIVQPALPRFVRPGDTFMAGGIGRVVEGKGGPGRAELEVSGLFIPPEIPKEETDKENSKQKSLRGSQGRFLQKEPLGRRRQKQTILWAIGKPQHIFFPLSVPQDAASKKEKEVTIRLAVVRDEDQALDAFEVKLPVKSDTMIRRLEKFIYLMPGKTFSFPKPLEPVRPGTMEQDLAVTAEPALLKMLSGMNYLVRYPHGCLEQRISRLMPELVLMDTMSLIGREVRTREIKQMMDEMFVYLGTVQGSDGLYSFWPGSRRYVGLTAYVLEFLVEARKRGFNFDSRLFDRAVYSLKDSLRSDYSHFISGHSYFERVEAMTALAKTGYFDDAYAHDILSRAQNMNLFSESRVLHSFLMQKQPYHQAINTLTADLRKSLIFKLRDGEEKYGGLQYRARTWGGAVCSSEARTLAGITRALFKAEPQHPRNRVLIDELVNLGSGDGWGSTAANAAALLTLGDVLKYRPPEPKKVEVRAVFGTREKTAATGKKPVARIVSRQETPGTFSLVTNDLDAQPMAMVSMSYQPAGNGDKIKARSDGFVVSRRLLVYKDPKLPPEKHPAEVGKTLILPMGTIVEEHIRVVNAEDRFYVAVNAPFAAGFEPMNPNLATSPPEAKPAGTFSQQPDYALYADDAVTFYFDQLPKGTYDFYFRLRTAVEGSFSHPPATAELMYQLPVRGNSNGLRIEVLRRDRD